MEDAVHSFHGTGQSESTPRGWRPSQHLTVTSVPVGSFGLRFRAWGDPGAADPGVLKALLIEPQPPFFIDQPFWRHSHTISNETCFKGEIGLASADLARP